MSSGDPGNTGNLSYSSLETEVTMERAAQEVPEDPPFHMLLLGNFSGRATGNGVSEEKLTARSLRAFQIDRDDFEVVLQRICPRVEVFAGDRSGLTLEFKSLDDFHPDSLFNSVHLFDELRDVRRRLGNVDSFSGAAREVRAWFDEESAGGEPDLSVSGESGLDAGEVSDEAGLLDDILGAKTRDAGAYSAKNVGNASVHSLLGAFAKELMDPFLVRVDEDEQARLISIVDELSGNLMRGILRDEGFRALEAMWRGLYLVCRRVETSKDLKIFAADVGKEEFVEGLKADNKELAELLFGKTGSGPEREPWAFIGCAYDFDLNVDDIAALMRAGAIAQAAGSPFVSHIRPSMLGFDSFVNSDGELSEVDNKSDTAEAKLWTALRASEVAASVGLIVPRLLGRLPYGAESDPTEVFEFEEFSGDASNVDGKHGDYLWMNPVFGFCVVLAASFSRNGWEIGGRYELDLNGLPMHVLKNGGTKPCAEFEMTDAFMDLLLGEGLMAFGAFRGTDRARLGGIQSVKFPQKALAGRWS